MRLHEPFHALAGLRRVFRNDDREGHLVGLAEGLAPLDKVLDVGDRGIRNELIEAVDKDMTDVKIAGMKAADKAL